MSYRAPISIAVAAILGIAFISTDALAYRGVGRVGGVRAGGMHVGGVYRGGLIVVPMCAAAWESALVPRPLVQR